MTQDNRTYLKRFQWLRFIEDFAKFLPLPSSSDAAENPAAESIAPEADGPSVTFQRYAQSVKIESEAHRVLDFSAFVKAIVTLLVQRHAPVIQGIDHLTADNQWLARRTSLMDDIPATHKGEYSLRIRRAASNLSMVRLTEHVLHNNTPRNEALDETEDPAVLELEAYMGAYVGRWVNEAQHERLVFDYATHGEQEEESVTLKHIETIKSADAFGDFSSPMLPPAHQQLQSPQGPAPSPLQRVPSISVDNTSFVAMLPAVGSLRKLHVNSPLSPRDASDTVKPQDAVRRLTNQILFHCEREQHGNLWRKQKDEAARDQRMIERLRRQLDEEKEKREKAEAALGTRHAEAQLANFMAFRGPSVLQAEKEELQCVFVHELEKRKTQLQSDMVQEENLRDLERDRLIGNLRDQMQSADHMFKRMQATVRAQAEALEKQSEVLTMLRNRVNVLSVDSQFMREIHDQLVVVVDKGKHRDVLDAVDNQKLQHDKELLEIVNKMMEEARREGRKTIKTTKDLAAVVKRGAPKTSPDALTLEANAIAQEAASGFELPEVTSVVVTYTQEQVEARINEALDRLAEKERAEAQSLREQLSQAECEHNQKLKDLSEQLTSLAANLEDEKISRKNAEDELVLKEIEHNKALEVAIEEATRQAKRTRTPQVSPRISPRVSPRSSKPATPAPEGPPGEAAATPTIRPAGEPGVDGGGAQLSTQQSTTLSSAALEGPTAELTAEAALVRLPPDQQALIFQALSPEPPEICDDEAQTDESKPKTKVVHEITAIDEYAKYFGTAVDIVEHEIRPTDTIDAISAQYGVAKDDILKANFLSPPKKQRSTARLAVSASQEDSNEATPLSANLVQPLSFDAAATVAEPDVAWLADVDVALQGIVTKKLRIPIPAGTKEQFLAMRDAQDHAIPGALPAALLSITEAEPKGDADSSADTSVDEQQHQLPAFAPFDPAALAPPPSLDRTISPSAKKYREVKNRAS